MWHFVFLALVFLAGVSLSDRVTAIVPIPTL
jgi:hypothetical protein